MKVETRSASPFARNLAYTYHSFWASTKRDSIQRYLNFSSLHNVPVFLGDMKGALEAHKADGTTTEVPLLCRVDTLDEVDYYKHGGILPFVLRQLLAA